MALADVMRVGSAADKTSAVIGLMGSNPPCGQCLMGCATAKDSTSCAMACASGGVIGARNPEAEESCELHLKAAKRATATKEDVEPVLRLTKLMGLIGDNFFGSSLGVFILAFQQAGARDFCASPAFGTRSGQ